VRTKHPMWERFRAVSKDIPVKSRKKFYLLNSFLKTQSTPT